MGEGTVGDKDVGEGMEWDGMVEGKAGEVNREWYSRKIMDEMSKTEQG